MATEGSARRAEAGDTFLIDSNVLIDIFTEDSEWQDWSEDALAEAVRAGVVGINPLIFAEISVRFDDIRDLDERLPESIVRRMPLPYRAGFLAAKAHQAYRRRGGSRETTLPDFYIGAHAVVDGLTIVTRDARRYLAAFPMVKVIAP